MFKQKASKQKGRNYKVLYFFWLESEGFDVWEGLNSSLLEGWPHGKQE